MPSIDNLKKLRELRFEIAIERAEHQIACLKDGIVVLEALQRGATQTLQEDCSVEEAFYEAAVLAETANQVVLNEATTNAPIYAAASAAAYDVMIECWSGGPSG